MTDEIEKLIKQFQGLEERIEHNINEQHPALRYHLREGRDEFEREVAAPHRKLRTGLFTYLRTSLLPTLLISPVIYRVVVPIAFLDLGVTVYQAVCFRIWGIRRVGRATISFWTVIA